MKTNLLNIITGLAFTLAPAMSFAQSPPQGTTTKFALFTTVGAITCNTTDWSHITGDLATNNGSSSGFGNIDGIWCDQSNASGICATDLLTLYGNLNTATSTGVLVSPIGNGATITPGVYDASGASVLAGTLTLDGQNLTNPVFIIRVSGQLDVSGAAKVKLKNGAVACNVFWKIEGVVSMATNVSMKGTVVANNSAIHIATGDTLEGRALAIAGAIDVDGVLIYTPIGCGSPVLTGPPAASLALHSTECFGIFGASGAVTNTGVTTIKGDVGSNSGACTGWDPLKVSGTIHTNPDPYTARAASDLDTLYNHLDSLTMDIRLWYPAQFGHNLVLTPHVYRLEAATVLTDTLYLNAEGNPNAIFVIKSDGALSTSTHAKVALINGASPNNVYWLIQGAVSIAKFSQFCGNMVINAGALGAIDTGVVFNGRILSKSGALSTASSSTTMLPVCTPLGIQSLDKGTVAPAAVIFPNPFTTSVNIQLNADLNSKVEWKLYNVLGEEIMNTLLTNQSTSIETSDLAAGIYIYQVIKDGKVIQSGKLVSQK
jgi:hypothetical protein